MKKKYYQTMHCYSIFIAQSEDYAWTLFCVYFRVTEYI